ncbi:hypothetical protein ACLESO_32520 [Pyxidicoccus sp. 3LG]
MGPQGPPGSSGSLEDYPSIIDINWPHDGTGTIQLLQKLQLKLNSELADRFIERMPRIVQVWVEPVSDITKPSTPMAMLTLHGSAFAEEATVISWTLSDDLAALQQTINFGCRVLIRVHCGFICNYKEMVYSASTEKIFGVGSPHLPGGVFESWFFISRKGVVLPRL